MESWEAETAERSVSTAVSAVEPFRTKEVFAVRVVKVPAAGVVPPITELFTVEAPAIVTPSKVPPFTSTVVTVPRFVQVIEDAFT
jgi:hypothetical protein